MSARRALLDAGPDSVDPAALKWVHRGLEVNPDSLPLNYVLALLLIESGRHSDAVEPAARLLAGLLETRNYHHEWETGMWLLEVALTKDAAVSQEPARRAEEWRAARAPATLRSEPFAAGHGCFTSGGSAAVRTRSSPD